MHTEEPPLSNLDSLMAMLAHKDGLIRKKAREELEEMGAPAVLPLCETLRSSKDKQARWAAAKALGTLDRKSVV